MKGDASYKRLAITEGKRERPRKCFLSNSQGEKAVNRGLSKGRCF